MSAAPFAITCDRILDGTDTPVLRDGALVVADGCIAAIGPRATVNTSDMRVIEAGDRTLLPGLLDSHAHTYGYHSRKWPSSGAPEEIGRDVLEVVRGLSELARSGVVAVRDCGYPDHAIFAIREASVSGPFPSPRMVVCGRGISASGGHGATISVRADGVDAVRRAVRLECKAGADWIKLMVTGGTATPGEQVSDVQFTFEEVAAAVDEAHRRGRKVCAHCSNLAGTKLALEAGIDCVEHGIDLDDEAVHMMSSRGVWLSAAIKCTEVEGANRPEDEVPAFIAARAGTIYQTQMASFRRAVAAGVRVSAATDGGPAYFPLTGRSLVRELVLLGELGLTPAEVIQIATSRTAELLGFHDGGSLQVGKRADLLVVDGDPLDDLSALGSPWMVSIEWRIIRGPDCR